jgi:glycine/D-amino acid oxidase-like deaminating enzyme
MVRLRRGGPPAVETRRGRIVAERVVLAMNAWSAGIPDLARLIVVVGSDIVATAPCPQLLQELGYTGGLAISDSRLFTHYYRLTRDGRMVFGKGGGDFAFGARIDGLYDGDSRYRPELERMLAWFYPEFAKVAKPRTWSGPIDRTMTGLPVFGRLRDCPDISYGLGYSGNGVGPSYVGGRVLASLCLDRDDEWSRLPLVGARAAGFPPEPFRYVGARVVQSALRRKERAEDAGRAPRRIDVALSARMPGGMVPVAKKDR